MADKRSRRQQRQRQRQAQRPAAADGADGRARTPQRTCDGCTACCVAMGVEELQKQPFSPCRHAVDGAGCGCYETRPASCRNYQCIWVQGALPDAFWPKLSGVVMDMGRPKDAAVREEDLWLTMREVRPGALTAPPMKAFIEQVRRRRVVVILSAEGRRVVGPPDRLAALGLDPEAR